MLVQRAMDLRLGDQIDIARGRPGSSVFKTPGRGASLVTVVGLERIFGPKIKVTVMDGINPDYSHEPPRYTEEFACLELLELEPRPKMGKD